MCLTIGIFSWLRKLKRHIFWNPVVLFFLQNQENHLVNEDLWTSMRNLKSSLFLNHHYLHQTVEYLLILFLLIGLEHMPWDKIYKYKLVAKRICEFWPNSKILQPIQRLLHWFTPLAAFFHECIRWKSLDFLLSLTRN